MKNGFSRAQLSANIRNQIRRQEEAKSRFREKTQRRGMPIEKLRWYVLPIGPPAKCSCFLFRFASLAASNEVSITGIAVGGERQAYCSDDFSFRTHNGRLRQ